MMLVFALLIGLAIGVAAVGPDNSSFGKKGCLDILFGLCSGVVVVMVFIAAGEVLASWGREIENFGNSAEALYRSSSREGENPGISGNFSGLLSVFENLFTASLYFIHVNSGVGILIVFTIVECGVGMGGVGRIIRNSVVKRQGRS